MTGTKKRRRRGIQSDWILGLQRTRKARRLRNQDCTVDPVPQRTSNPSETSNSSIESDMVGQEVEESPLRHDIQDSMTSTLRNDIGSNTAPLTSTAVGEVRSQHHPSLEGSLLIDDEQEIAVTTHVREDYLQFFTHTPPSVESSAESTDKERHRGDDSDRSMSSVDSYRNPCAGNRTHPPSEERLSPETAQQQVQGNRTSHFPRRDADLKSLQRVRRKWENPLSLTAMLAVVGSVRYSVQNYEYCRDIVMEHVPHHGKKWPTYKKVHNHFKDVIRFCLPASEIVEFQLRGRGDKESDKVRIFLPSAWARLDVETSVVYNEMYPDGVTNFNYLEKSGAVQNRGKLISACDHIYLPSRSGGVVCGPGSLIQICVERRRFHFNTPYVISTTDSGMSFRALTTVTWCVGARRNPNPSFERATKCAPLSSLQRRILMTLSTADPPAQSADHDDLIYTVLPGDICTLLSAERTTASHEYDAILVHRFWRSEYGTPSSFIIWLQLCDPTEKEPLSLEVGTTTVVHDISLIRHSRTQATPTSQQCRGTLSNGMPFVVYRILLYCDDFTKSSGPYSKGSAGGCYFLPMSLPPEARRSTSAVRIISLTPPGISTNKVLHYIVDDIINATTHGIDGKTPTGEDVKIFIDVMGFIGDYPAATGAVDVIGHTGRSPCNLCSFRRLHDSEATGSRFGYTTSVHAGNSTFLRHEERHLSLRKSKLPDKEANTLGMTNAARVNDISSPLIHLSIQLQAVRSSISLNSAGQPVVPGFFSPYRSNVIAPDHLLTGLSKNVLNTMFQSLDSNDMRVKANLYLCAALRENGLLTQKEVFNTEKLVLHSMTLSELYCVMLVAQPTFQMLTKPYPASHVSRHAFRLLAKLQNLIAMTFWWPKSEIDGYEAAKFVHESTDAYHSKLKSESKAYVRLVDKFCRKFPDHKGNLDKPNLHRLIELYEHSLPMFGHAREFMELVFECAHQPLKQCIADSNNHNSHLFATEHCVSNDWQGRLASLSRDLEDDCSAVRLTAQRGIRRLLLGEETRFLEESTHKDFINESDEMFARLFSKAVRRRFRKDSRVSNFGSVKHSAWVARKEISIKNLSRCIDLTRSQTKQIVRASINWINALYPSLPGEAEESTEKFMKLFKSARRVRLTNYGRKTGRTTGTDIIMSNSVIRCLVHPDKLSDKVLETSTEHTASPTFFIVIAILQRKNDIVWAICSKCIITSTNHIQVKSALNVDNFQILRLTPSVRRIAVYHVCEDTPGGNFCKLDFVTNRVDHAISPLSGAKMFFQTRGEGYPPRQA